MDCTICAGVAGDEPMCRVQVWEDDLWRLTTSIGPGDITLGFSYLEPKRHIPDITGLSGPEAETFGEVVARCSSALKQATRCELVYLYVFGGSIPHLHVHLAPHNAGDGLNDDLLKGAFETRQLDNGAVGYVSLDYPALPAEDCVAVADAVRELLA
jgi:diadenosine tetraphosphate (Ap4A) HIT family hydrolase